MTMFLDVNWPGLDSPDLATIETEHLIFVMFGASRTPRDVHKFLLAAISPTLQHFRVAHRTSLAFDIPDPTPSDGSVEGALGPCT